MAHTIEIVEQKENIGVDNILCCNIFQMAHLLWQQ